MSDKVNSLLSAEKSSLTSPLNYIIYSAHDDQIINMLNFLGVDFDWVPYAATVTFELKYSARCLEAAKNDGIASEDCFGVSVFSNKVPLRFDDYGCTGDLFTPYGCSYPEFVALMTKKMYSGVDAACLIIP